MENLQAMEERPAVMEKNIARQMKTGFQVAMSIFSRI